MFVLAKKKDESRWQVQIVESRREGDKVRQKIVRNIGVAHSLKECDEFKRIGEAAIIDIKNRRQPVLPFINPAEFYAPRKRAKPANDAVIVDNLREEKRINEGITDIFGEVYKNLGLNCLIEGTDKNLDWNGILENCTLARIADPRSKLSTAAFIEKKFDVKIPVQKIYRMLDHLVNHEAKAKNIIAHQTLSLFDEINVLFFDVTTLYFESIEQDELRRFGYSKDGKFYETQVVLALVTTNEGLPVTYRLLPGNTYEGHSLVDTVFELKQLYGTRKVRLIADRAMFTEENLNFMDCNEVEYIVAAKLKAMSREQKEAILATDTFKGCGIFGELCWAKELPHKTRRLVVNYSTSRAKKDKSDRDRLIDKLLKKAGDDDKINVKDLIANQGVKKYLRKINKQKVELKLENIEAEAKWDGMHGVITNIRDQSMSFILESYRSLWQIEEAFRVNKHSLKMRPIYHWTPRRIRAHVLLCYLAFAVTKHALYHLKRKIKCTSLSVDAIRSELLAVEASTIIDVSTKKRYVIPSLTTTFAQEIYCAFSKRRDEKPYAI